jgi:hypothetical protein
MIGDGETAGNCAALLIMPGSESRVPSRKQRARNEYSSRLLQTQAFHPLKTLNIPAASCRIIIQNICVYKRLRLGNVVLL